MIMSPIDEILGKAPSIVPIHDISEMRRIIGSSPKNFGHASSFIHVHDDFGLKYWADAEMAKSNYEKNQYAAQELLAPRVGSSLIEFTFDQTHKTPRFGFFVEKVETIFDDWFAKFLEANYPKVFEEYSEDSGWRYGFYNNNGYRFDDDGMFEYDGQNEQGIYPNSLKIDRLNEDFPLLKLPNICEQLSQYFEVVRDIHFENVGFTKDGRFLCIDFDYCEI